eukprot:TRINITY_DN11464_c0_g1_i1.p1 TRINITY_DN11464_c0_g1~~TRINITY_DN11464_c0_g1_i1.p1  ORF type:complete len:532 (+),score=108.97 TRINITY_DN11464_c0_g1_i1:72-1667(+)
MAGVSPRDRLYAEAEQVDAWLNDVDELLACQTRRSKIAYGRWNSAAGVAQAAKRSPQPLVPRAVSPNSRTGSAPAANVLRRSSSSSNCSRNGIGGTKVPHRADHTTGPLRIGRQDSCTSLAAASSVSSRANGSCHSPRQQRADVSLCSTNGRGCNGSFANSSTCSFSSSLVPAPPVSSRSSRVDELYHEVFDRQQRQRLLAAEAEQKKREALEDGRQQWVVQQRQRQRFYHPQDQRTHIEREEEMQRRRQARMAERVIREEQRAQEEMNYCTFRPQMFTRPRSRSPGNSPRCSSPRNGLGLHGGGLEASAASAGPTPRGGSSTPGRSWHNAKLQAFLDKQGILLNRVAQLDTDAQAHEEKGAVDGSNGAAPHDGKSVEVSLYSRRIAIVHALERLDLQVMALPPAELDALLAMGFRMQVADEVRRAPPQLPLAPQLVLATPPSQANGETGCFVENRHLNFTPCYNGEDKIIINGPLVQAGKNEETAPHEEFEKQSPVLEENSSKDVVDVAPVGELEAIRLEDDHGQGVQDS